MKENNKDFELLVSLIYENSKTNYRSKVNVDAFEKTLESIFYENNDNKHWSERCNINNFFTFHNEVELRSYGNPENKNFNKKYDLIFSGCSQTEGWDVSPYRAKDIGNYDYIWGFQIANKYNKEALNLGLGGFGAESIVKGLMDYFQKNGHPKVVLVLLPDLGRMEFVDNDKILHKNITEKLIENLSLFFTDDFKYEKISKSPHKSENVLPWTQAFYRSIQSIIFLDQYCKSNNIYLKYSSWSSDTILVLESLRKILPQYSNYCKIDKDTFDALCNLHGNNEILTCHNELKSNYPEDLWDSGIDGLHMGIHHHIHFAELFSKEIDNDNPWN